MQRQPLRRQERQPAVAAVAADEAVDEVVGRAGEQLPGLVVLGQLAADAEHRDLVAELDRLVDVVGDEHDRLAQLGLQPEELVLQALADHRVDRAERLVHQQHGRVGGQRAGDADALLLATGELAGVAARDLGRQPDGLQQLGRPVRAFFLFQPSSSGTVAMLSTMVRCGKRPACWIT